MPTKDMRNDFQEDKTIIHGPTEDDIERYGDDFSEPDVEGGGPNNKRFWKLIVFLVILIMASSLIAPILIPVITTNNKINTVEPQKVKAFVTRIIDPRTIVVDIEGKSSTVRYIGIEAGDFNNQGYDIGIAANKYWILGKTVYLEADINNMDLQGRFLRYVWLGDSMINLALIGSGLARTDKKTKNIRYKNLFLQQENSARAKNLGLWSVPTY